MLIAVLNYKIPVCGLIAVVLGVILITVILIWGFDFCGTVILRPVCDSRIKWDRISIDGGLQDEHLIRTMSTDPNLNRGYAFRNGCLSNFCIWIAIKTHLNRYIAPVLYVGVVGPLLAHQDHAAVSFAIDYRGVVAAVLVPFCLINRKAFLPACIFQKEVFILLAVLIEPGEIVDNRIPCCCSILGLLAAWAE